MVDKLLGLKENVIIGKLIPARAEIVVPRREHIAELDLPESLLLEEEEELERMLAEKEAGSGYRQEQASAILDEEDEATGELADADDFTIAGAEPAAVE